MNRKEAQVNDPRQVTEEGVARSETGEQGRSHVRRMQASGRSRLPSTAAGLTGSMRETISARSVKEALGQVST